MVYVGFVAAERILYLPSVGFCLLVGFGFQQCVIRMCRQPSTRNRIVLITGAATLIASLSFRTVLRNQDWNDEEQLYRSAIAINPPKGSLLSSQCSHSDDWVAAMIVSVCFTAPFLVYNEGRRIV